MVNDNGADIRVINSNITLEVPQSTDNVDLSKYLSFSLSDTTSTDAVMAVLIDSEGNTVSAISDVQDGVVYDIAYMKSSTGSGFTLVGKTGYTLTLSVVTG